MPPKQSKTTGAVRTRSASPKHKVGAKGAASKRKARAKSAAVRPEIDVLSPAAVINAYYMCHNVADCLDARGFPWEGAKKGKKKKKKKKS